MGSGVSARSTATGRPAADLVGRASERDLLAGFLDASAAAAAACVVVGTTGAGKTALVHHAVDVARGRGHRVLAHCPAPADASLALVALTDLFGLVDDADLAALAPPLRTALEIALLRRDAGPAPIETRTIATAVTALLSHLADDGPVLMAVDDSLWLDPPSARALAFAARRLLDRPLGWLVTVREPEQAGPPLDLARVLPADALTTIVVGPLSVDDVFTVVRDRLAVTLPRPTLTRIHQAAAGNPLFALELARGFAASGDPVPITPLRVPASLRDAFAARIATLSAPARAALLCAAASRDPRVGTVSALASAAGLDEAVAAGIVGVDGDRVVFAQPLLASTAYEMAGDAERRTVHAALAERTADAEARGRHLALSTAGPSDGVAAALEAAAVTARARAAPDVAADLAELAVARTPDASSEAAWRRRLAFADYLFDAGSARKAAAAIGSVAIASVPASLRAQAVRLQAVVVYEAEGTDQALAALRRALAAAGDDVTLRAEALTLMARIADDGREAAALAAEAIAVLEAQDNPDDAQLAEALLASASADFRLGRGLDRARFERAIALEDRAGAPRKAADGARASLSALLKYADCYAEAHAALLDEYHLTLASGDESGLAGALAHLPQLELWLGDWAAARRWADEHHALAQQTQQVNQLLTAIGNLALVEAHCGQLDDALTHAAELLAAAQRGNDEWNVDRAHGLLGFIALNEGDAPRAVAHFAPWWDGLHATGLLEPGYARWHGDFVEALVGAGELVWARVVLDDVEARARSLDRASALATVGRGRALVAAAEGDLSAALAFADAALLHHERAYIPFERARTRLVKGQIHRRSREKRLAKEAIEGALAVFEELGAAGWVERAVAELERVNIRPAAPLDLTATERRVAELAASGLTNRQVADAAFISPKTVEANLARVYRKLGISSRAELGQRMSQT